MKGKRKRENTSFIFVAVVQKQESNREMQSVFFGTRAVPEPAFLRLLNTTREMCTEHRQLGGGLVLGGAAGGGARKLKL